eukprot:SAG11_NODE_10_length_27955_cov_15.365235_13_plen_254_part_00
MEWLTDLPQDDIVSAAASCLSAASLNKLVQAAEAAADTLSLVKLAVLAGKAKMKQDGSAQALECFLKAEDQLVQLATREATPELRSLLDRLEIDVLGHIFALNEGFAEYGDRPDYLGTTYAGRELAVDLMGLLFYYQAQYIAFSGCIMKTNDDWVRTVKAPFRTKFLQWMKTVAHGAAASPVRSLRERCMIMLCSVAPFCAMLDHPQFDWDETFGPRGSFLTTGTAAYDYDVHNRWCSEIWPMDCLIIAVSLR